MRRYQFEMYLDKVFDFSPKVGALPDSGSRHVRHNRKKIFDAVFLGTACQFPTFDLIELIQYGVRNADG